MMETIFEEINCAIYSNEVFDINYEAKNYLEQTMDLNVIFYAFVRNTVFNVSVEKRHLNLTELTKVANLSISVYHNYPGQLQLF